MGLFTPKIEKHQKFAFDLCLSIMEEDERVYRNHVELFSNEFQPAQVTGKGLLKARLLASCFPMFGFSVVWSKKEPQQTERFAQSLSGLAIMPLVEPGANPSYSREAAMEFAGPWVREQLNFIGEETVDGPSQPSFGSTKVSTDDLDEFADVFDLPTARKRELEQYLKDGGPTGHVTEGFRNLVSTCHESLVDSVGDEQYTDEARDQFETMFYSGLLGKFRVLTEMIAELG